MSSSTKTIPIGGTPGIGGGVLEKKRQPRRPVEAQWGVAPEQGDGAHRFVAARSGDVFVLWPVAALSS